MICAPHVSKPVIRRHYDLSTLFYRLLWGPHIHHGLWEKDESPREAQSRLTEVLAERAHVGPGQQVYDIGCGMGGSAIHLARTRRCRVLGVTISPVQRGWASFSAAVSGVAGRARFVRADAESIVLPPQSADVVWSIECTEHLFDKPAFFRRAASWLRPGGRLAICAWLAGRHCEDEPRKRQVEAVCDGFFCPSLATMDEYRRWMSNSGLKVETAEDWTARVVRTWEICQQRVRFSGVRWLARLIDRDTVTFLDRFSTILEAYRSGAMQYGCLVASKPSEDR